MGEAEKLVKDFEENFEDMLVEAKSIEAKEFMVKKVMVLFVVIITTLDPNFVLGYDSRTGVLIATYLDIFRSHRSYGTVSRLFRNIFIICTKHHAYYIITQLMFIRLPFECLEYLGKCNIETLMREFGECRQVHWDIGKWWHSDVFLLLEGDYMKAVIGSVTGGNYDARLPTVIETSNDVVKSLILEYVRCTVYRTYLVLDAHAAKLISKNKDLVAIFKECIIPAFSENETRLIIERNKMLIDYFLTLDILSVTVE